MAAPPDAPSTAGKPGRPRKIVIIGAGHNGLVAAFYLAKAGLKPLVLERRAQVGGIAATEEFHPGFKVSSLVHTAGPLAASIARDLQLEQHGLKWIDPEPRLIALSPDGRALPLFSNASQAAYEVAKFDDTDGRNYPEVQATLARIAAVLADLLPQAPPDLDRAGAGDLLALLRTGRGVRKLAAADLYRLLRWTPMPIADLVAEWFRTDLLRAAIAARGLQGTAFGPMSAGSALVLLLRAASEHLGGTSGATLPGPGLYPIGGMGALTNAVAAAARAAGAEIRTNSEVAQIVVKDGAVRGVVLSSGEEISAAVVVSNADPRRTLMALAGPDHLGPQLVARLQKYRCAGTVAKMNLALDGLPQFTALKNSTAPASALSGRIHVGPSIEYLERAFDASKYGGFSEQPVLEITIPSIADASLAPAGKHVMSVIAQYAPYKLRGSEWAIGEQGLGDSIIRTLAQYAPDLPPKIVAGQLLTPARLEQEFALTGGHLWHGELALDQLYAMRPQMEWSHYRMPLRNLYLCGSGTHPGVALSGQSGANAARVILKEKAWR
jgi:phytoene dehydrogenase-like protein